MMNEYIDAVIATNEDHISILLVSRNKMYDIDKEYWSTVVEPAERGFCDQKILFLTESDNPIAIRNVLTILTVDTPINIKALLRSVDIIPALCFLSNFKYESNGPIINLHKALIHIYLDLPPESILSLWKQECASLLDKEIVHSKTSTWSGNHLWKGGWIIPGHFPRVRPNESSLLGDNIRFAQYWIRTYQHGYAQRIPPLIEKLPLEIYQQVPKSIHSKIRSSIIARSSMTKFSGVFMRKILNKGNMFSQIYEIACNHLCSLSCDDITSIMYSLLECIFTANTERNMCYIRDTMIAIKCIYTGIYSNMDTPLSEHESQVLRHISKISSTAWDKYVPHMGDRQKRLVAFHPLSYLFTEDDSWYDNYAQVIYNHMQRKTLYMQSKRSLSLLPS